MFSKKDLGLIENLVKEKGWSGSKLRREFPNKLWTKSAINRLVRKIIVTGTSDRKHGSGRPRTGRTEANIALVNELALSQEDHPGTHQSQHQISKQTHVNRSSVKRIINHDLKLKSVKRLHEPQRKNDARLRRLDRARELLRAYGHRDVKRMCFQDEKDLTLQVPTNRQNNRCYTKGVKKDVSLDRLISEGNKFSKKVMISCCVSYEGITAPFFVDPQAIKVTGQLYTDHLREDLLPACRGLYPNGDMIFVQDGAPSHTSNLCQAYLREELGNNFVDKTAWPPSSPDCNPLDYYFWDALTCEVYKDRRTPFTSLEEIKDRVLQVWPDLASRHDIRRRAIDQFIPRLQEVVKNNGNTIKLRFG